VVAVEVNVAVLVTVLVTITGVRLRVGEGGVEVRDAVNVGVICPGFGARAMAIHPMQ
jgi:hypothetical protein